MVISDVLVFVGLIGVVDLLASFLDSMLRWGGILAYCFENWIVSIEFDAMTYVLTTLARLSLLKPMQAQPPIY